MEKKWYLSDQSSSYRIPGNVKLAGAEIPLSGQTCELSRATMGEFVEILKDKQIVRPSSFLKPTRLHLEGTLNHISWGSGPLLWFHFNLDLPCVFLPSYFFKICNFTFSGSAVNRPSFKKRCPWNPQVQRMVHHHVTTVTYGPAKLRQLKNGSGPLHIFYI